MHMIQPNLTSVAKISIYIHQTVLMNTTQLGYMLSYTKSTHGPFKLNKKKKKNP